MLKDILGQAWEAMLYNRRRTAITMIGMAWGIATVVLLLAYGAGFTPRHRSHLCRSGAPTPSASSPAAPASRPAATKPVSRSASPRTTSTASRTPCPDIIHISPQVQTGRAGAERSAHLHLDRQRRPARPTRTSVKLDVDQGRFFNGAEDQQRAHVCVIGSEAKTKLFSGGWAVGETIRLNGVIFTVVGVLAAQDAGGATDDRNRQIYIPFNTMSDLKDTTYLDGIWINYQRRLPADRKEPCATLWPPRTTSGPRDHDAIYVANLLHRSSISSRFSPSRCRFCSRWSARSRSASPASGS